jgi:hypothetical protein
MLKLSNIIASYLIVASCFASVAAQYNCDAGCSLDTAIMGGPVCGEDLLTYVNGCVASCQVSGLVTAMRSLAVLTLVSSTSGHQKIYLWTVLGRCR